MENRILNQDEAIEFLRTFENREISHVWRGAGTAIFLEFGELAQNNRDNLIGEFSISIEWSWRIEDRNSILLGSFSEDQQISKVIGILKGKKLIKAEFFGRLKEIHLQLDGDIWLSSFATVEGNPEWAGRNDKKEWLYFRKGRYVVEKTHEKTSAI